jgi:hypothetical protein
MVGGQRIQVGLPHTGKTVEVTVEPDTYQITVEPGITITAPRTTSREIRRHKACSYDRPAFNRLDPVREECLFYEV